ncbi:ABC transporter ATP-binding protein [Aurantimonas endophytica]|uniref:ATP-binding cassette subfamily B protein n=1 Tax=Aurantimonas endophytica TaxID=1522175 RepID=A0A7W6HGA0_9HYPH|nr:ABC transporter ATP-binding protein [Aurantimonas endophytica]MBB4004644.1 ATP-binding cassette subfamily B protein [Aurantimonas endophytica]MCO6405473.1 ATP-binding cassette domain-containing protein [Aurantimonas endophytica]
MTIAWPLNREPDVSTATVHSLPGTPGFLTAPVAFVLHYVKRHPILFFCLFLVAFLAASLSVGVHYGMKLLVDAITGAQPNPDVAWMWLGVFITLIAAESVLWRASGWLAARTTISVGVDIRLDLLDYMVGHPVRYFHDNLAGALGHRVTATAGAFGALTNRTVWDIAPPIINFLGALIIFAFMDGWMTAALAVFAIAVTYGLIHFGVRGREIHRTYAEQAGKVGGELIDVISNVWAIKAFSAKQRERSRLAGAFVQEAVAQRRSWMYTERSRIIHDILLVIMAGTMLVWAMLLWDAGRITPGDVVVVSALTFRILHGSRDFAMALVEMTQQFAYLGETLRIIGQPHEIPDAPGAATIVPQKGDIVFTDVVFGYGDNRRIIEKFSLHIPAGQKIGIVGPSGAGKSTILHLLQRLHDVQSGEIQIDGCRVRDLKQDSLRAAIAVVPQEVVLFHRSVMENIRFARPDASDDEIFAAAKAAYCHDFIMELTQGYDTLVGERGAKLSGGQRQRIGIARAFLKDTPIILLDEATSGLDTQSEIEVQAALARLMRDRTVVAIAHRLSTVAAFDRIIVVMDGRIVEDGSPAELRRADGIFARMWSLQAEGLSVDDITRNMALREGPEGQEMGVVFGRRPESIRDDAGAASTGHLLPRTGL